MRAFPRPVFLSGCDSMRAVYDRPILCRRNCLGLVLPELSQQGRPPFPFFTSHLVRKLRRHRPRALRVGEDVEVGKGEAVDEGHGLFELLLALDRGKPAMTSAPRPRSGMLCRELFHESGVEPRVVGAPHGAKDAGRAALERDVEVRDRSSPTSEPSTRSGVNSVGSMEERRRRSGPGVSTRRAKERRPACRRERDPSPRFPGGRR